MARARQLTEVGLALRDQAGIKVRQPLSDLMAGEFYRVPNEYLEIVKDELNVKDISITKEPAASFSSSQWVSQSNELVANDHVHLNKEITDSLKEEGTLRELLRFIQNERKKAGLNPGAEVTLLVETDNRGQSLMAKFANDIKRQTNLRAIVMEVNDGGEITIDNLIFKLQINK